MSTNNGQLMDQIFTLMRLLKGEMSFEKDSNQLTLNQVQVIIFIEQHQSVKMSDIADYFKITMPSATSLINSLVTKGYVVRTNDIQDRRSVQIRLAPKTLNFFEKLTTQRTEKISSLLSALTNDEKEKLLSIVRKMIETVENR